MSGIYIHGLGAVSPAGWGVEALRRAVEANVPIPEAPLLRPEVAKPIRVRRVPTPQPRPNWLAHPRLRRTSAITHFMIGAALEALQGGIGTPAESTGRSGIVSAVYGGCVQYSRRFYQETLQDPATASPLVFPETVLNAPASHLSAFLESTAPNYTLVGDQSAFGLAVGLAAQWLMEDRVNGCLVVGAEEADWVTAEAYRLFGRRAVVSEGAGAIYLSRTPSQIELAAVTLPEVITATRDREVASQRMRAQVGEVRPNDLLVDGLLGVDGWDRAEAAAWMDISRRVSPKRILGDGLAASGGWQCVLAVEALRRNETLRSWVSLVGLNQQAITVGWQRSTGSFS